MADAYWSSVKSLLHFDGSNGATTTTDSSPQSQTRSYSFGTAATISTAAAFAGGSSLRASSTSSALTSDASADFVTASSSFTIDGWFYIDSAGSSASTFNTTIASIRRSGTTCLSLSWAATSGGTSGNFTLRGNGSTVGVSSSTLTLSLNTWHFISLSTDGTTTYVHLDGVLVLSDSTQSFSNGVTSCTLSYGGRLTTDACLSFFDEWRFTRVARYGASSYSPPTGVHEVGLNTLSPSGFEVPQAFGTGVLSLGFPAIGFAASATFGAVQFNVGIYPQGFSSTTFGTPGPTNFSFPVSGWLATAFGSALLGYDWYLQPAGFVVTQLGTVTWFPHHPVQSIGQLTRFGTPSIPNAPWQVPSLGSRTRFGTPRINTFQVSSLVARARFGRPVLRHTGAGSPTTLQVRGFRTTVMGTPVGLYYTAP